MPPSLSGAVPPHSGTSAPLDPRARRPGIALVSISRLQTLCETVAPRYTDRARFYSVREGYGAAVAALQSYVESGAVDVVLAAGSNGAYLRENLSVPVVTVKVNGFDVLSAITRATTTWPDQPLGLVLHETVSRELDDLGELLKIQLRQRAYRSVDEVQAAVDALAAQGCKVIIGPGMACDLAQEAGLEHVFLYSLGAVEEAFERSVELARVSREKESKRMRLNTIVAHMRDGVAAFDENGQLEAVNPAMFSLLDIDAERVATQGARQFELTRKLGPMLRELSDDGVAIEERLAHIDARPFIVSCVPIYEHGMRSGAVVTVQDAQMAQRIDRSLRTTQRPRHLVAKHELAELVGDSPQIEKVRRLARTGASHDATVLLTGESGTGKELVAQGIHNASARRGNPFVAFNCAALPEGLIESELFGHDEGAFTGARRGGKAGLFEIAHTGTIFLDEIGEMPAALQSRLLRVLQEREVMRLGSGRPVPIDVRVIAATHRDLNALVAEGRFRADLYFRLNLLQVTLPALRERREDIRLLAQTLLSRNAAQYGLDATASKRILKALSPLFDRYDWPGNVRELENLLARAAIYLDNDVARHAQTLHEVFPELLRVSTGKPQPVQQAAEAGATAAPVTYTAALAALEAAGGNRAAASRALGISRTTFWRLMRSVDQSQTR
ncbi:propionate catabolism operon regulatory protein PrpR [Pandoraea fibrosis]|uniref:Propionate catabolism operon regulatory protein PrpR n=1 Tax=Pandoraea fibrosis TaxID=1891094 RepID=A0ABX6HLU9_9BURK|nr:propionate catabolism operon regulatory protein PrpR [Pandoraea fibrosis]QHE90418.1 propionate catabolism operon regulatory protein PrpR [Pandoraea fibrosis]QHF11250.1 propionate catabolism operon regulatory protein PrpR [Pandoraea fibrosis]